MHELHCYGNITRTRNVSEYMLVLALCPVAFMCTLLVPRVAVIKSLNEQELSTTVATVHERHRQTDRQTGQTGQDRTGQDRTDNGPIAGRTVLQTVAQKQISATGKDSFSGYRVN